MIENYRLLRNRKQIPHHLLERGKRTDLAILDAIGVALVRPAWLELFGRLEAGSRVRVLLLDPDGSALSAPLHPLWADAERLRHDIRNVIQTLGALGRELELRISIALYDQPPVSRYVEGGGFVYQSHFPSVGDAQSVPVAVLHAETLMAARAKREFEVLWKLARSVAIPDVPQTGHSNHQPWASGGVDLADGEPIHFVDNRNGIAAYLAAQMRAVSDVDVIDVAGAAQVKEDWQALYRRNPSLRMRILVLDPYGNAAHQRAVESTCWRGDHVGLRARIKRNAGRLADVARDSGLEVEIRAYDRLPISRYVRADGTILQSVYPGDASGRDLAVADLSKHTMLARRASMEFDVLWNRLSAPLTDVLDQ